MIVLHTVLVVSRLENEGAAALPLGQALFDHFCSDMDANLREMGVGDIAVPRKMKAIGEAFYGRKRAYEAALAALASEPVAQVLARNVYDGASGDESIRLAAYLRNAADSLAAHDGATLRRGGVTFPDPLRHAPASPLVANTGAP